MLLILLSLVVYRVTRFVLRDTLIETQRDWVYGKLLDPPKPWSDKLFELLSCPYCLSIWFAAAAVVGADQYTSVPLPWATWLAVAAGAMVAWRYIEHDHDDE